MNERKKKLMNAHKKMNGKKITRIPMKQNE